MDAELLLWLRQHRGRWAVFSAAFHHAERAPRVTSSLTAESPTIRSFQTILGVDTRTLATRVLRARKTRKSKLVGRGTDFWNFDGQSDAIFEHAFSIVF